MRRRDFRRHAERFWTDIPARFRVGATLLVHDDAEPDPEHPGVYLLGACEPAFGALEEALEAVGGVSPMDRESLIHLWYGSFEAMDAESRAFDWTGELEETLLHELTHHWEQRAGLDALDRFDAAQIENFRRRRGLPFAPAFWRDGVPKGERRWLIDGDLFIEIEGEPPWRVEPGDSGPALVVSPAPETTIAVVEGRGGVFDGERGQLVVGRAPARRRPWWRRLRALLGPDG